MALHFSKAELADRRKQTIEAMQKRGLDGLLIFRQESMYYLTGYDTFGYVFFQCLYLGADGRLMLLTRAPDLRQAQHTSDIDDIRVWIDAPNADPSVELREYLHDMDRQYARADLVICRSGAATLSELAAAGKPAILIPFPFAADDHQKKNAESLVAQGAAQMIEQKDLTADRLHSAVDDLRLHPEKRERMSTEIRKFHRPHAADLLAGEFIERIEDASR